MRQNVYAMFISDNHALLHFWCKENLVKHQKVSKYYLNDCSYKSLYVDVDCNGKISFQQLTNVTKNSILDVAWVLDLVFLEPSKILESGYEGVHIFVKLMALGLQLYSKGTTSVIIFQGIG